jgi:predicted nucleic acid-binding Zn ribbon protein
MENIFRSKAEIEEIVTMIRLNLYNHGIFCGPKEILKKMNESDEEPLPSERTISRILERQGLTYKRTGWYPGDELNG